MPTLNRPSGPLHYEVTNVTARWASEPETIPRSEIRIFPGARHALAHTHGAACAAALREFLARRLPAAS